MRTYKCYAIFNCDKNSSGMKYYSRTERGILKADTLASIKSLINKTLKKG
jgi:hypothetical protein